MTTQDFCRLTADEQYLYVEQLHQFVDAVRKMREMQKDAFHFKFSTFEQWEAQYAVDNLLKWL